MTSAQSVSQQAVRPERACPRRLFSTGGRGGRPGVSDSKRKGSGTACGVRSRDPPRVPASLGLSVSPRKRSPIHRHCGVQRELHRCAIRAQHCGDRCGGRGACDRLAWAPTARHLASTARTPACQPGSAPIGGGPGRHALGQRANHRQHRKRRLADAQQRRRAAAAARSAGRCTTKCQRSGGMQTKNGHAGFLGVAAACAGGAWQGATSVPFGRRDIAHERRVPSRPRARGGDKTALSGQRLVTRLTRLVDRSRAVPRRVAAPRRTWGSSFSSRDRRSAANAVLGSHVGVSGVPMPARTLDASARRCAGAIRPETPPRRSRAESRRSGAACSPAVADRGCPRYPPARRPRRPSSPALRRP